MIRAMLTGHRQVSPLCKNAMKALIEDLSNEGDVTVISGGNLGTKVAKTGADRMWALAAYELGVPYEIFVPLGYGLNYYGNNPEMMQAFKNMLESASEIVFAPSVLPFHFSHNFQRNDAMVKTANIFVVCSTDEPKVMVTRHKGGTVHACKSMIKDGIAHVRWIDSVSGSYEGVHPLLV